MIEATLPAMADIVEPAGRVGESIGSKLAPPDSAVLLSAHDARFFEHLHMLEHAA